MRAKKKGTHIFFYWQLCIRNRGTIYYLGNIFPNNTKAYIANRCL